MDNTIKKYAPFWRKPLHLAAIGLVSGWLGVFGVPTIASMSALPLATLPAIAQSSVTDEEVKQYARSVLTIDQYRNEAYTLIKDLLLTENMDINSVGVSCTSIDVSRVPRSIRRQVRGILIDYCNQSQDAVEENGMSSQRFNEITELHRSDETLYERIQQELLRLQQPAQ